jgi:hypothetical protein
MEEQKLIRAISHPEAVKWHVHGTLDEVQILNSKKN